MRGTSRWGFERAVPSSSADLAISERSIGRSSLHRVLHWKGKWNPDYTEGNRIMNKMLGHISAAGLPLRTYYEDAVFAKVANLWRRKVLILTTVAVALLLGVLVSVLLPTRYTADAFVRVGFTSSDTASGNNGGSIISVNASALVETDSRVSEHTSAGALRRGEFGVRTVRRRGGAGTAPVVAASLLRRWRSKPWIQGGLRGGEAVAELDRQD